VNPANCSGLGVAALHEALRATGCDGCPLGSQKGLIGPVLFRGDPNADLMFIGEAPGEDEDKTGEPFVGRSGKLLNKIVAAIGLENPESVYFGNTCKCRPIAPAGSGKKNVPPKAESIKACRPFLDQEVEQVKPKLIVLLGAPAVKNVLPAVGKKKMGDIVGTLHLGPHDTPTLVMYHPAFLLRKQNGKDYAQYRDKTLESCELIKAVLEEVKDEPKVSI
jgi:uracil-DNA glycosylase